MKKLTLLFLFALSSIYAIGQTGTVIFRDDNSKDKGHRSDIPVVTYNDNTISITSYSTIIDSHVVILFTNCSHMPFVNNL